MAGRAHWHDTSIRNPAGLARAGILITRRHLLRASRTAPLLLWFAACAGAQTQLTVAKPGEALPSFEVAAIREDTSGSGHVSVNAGNDTYRAENITLKSLVMNAWEIRSNAQIRGGPEDLLGKHFDVNARISQDDVARLAKLSREERSRYRALMLQSMLVDRFGLATHIETKTEPVFALVIAKGGPKFHPSGSDPAKDDGKAAHHGEGTWMSISMRGAELEAHHATLESLASTITYQSEAEGRLVVNKTGLNGDYDYTMKWAPEWMSARAAQPDPGSSDADPPGPSLLTALREQLGLKLVPEKAPVQVLVVDHVEPPSAK